MIIQCKNCSKKFAVSDTDIPEEGRVVQCGYCSDTWHQKPFSISTNKIRKVKTSKSYIPQTNESASVESIKASDGKTYKFMGNQWVELFASGKTGLFAKKKVGRELDKLTGRQNLVNKNKRIKKSKKVDPSSEILNEAKQLPTVSKHKEGIGFFSYFFIIIIIAFSAIGILKTFEDDLINYFPEAEYLYIALEEQLIYVSEAVKNIITIIQDLITSY